MRQTTLAQAVTCIGLGLHGGEPVELCLRPAPEDTGLCFRRRSDGVVHEIPARVERVCATTNATSLAAAGPLRGESARVTTVEHLLAALFAAGIDNAFIDVDAGEVPVMDGSAGPFGVLIEEAGRRRQSSRRRFLRVVESLEVVEGDRFVRLEPHGSARRGLEIDCTIDFAHPAIGRQRFVLPELTPPGFEKEIARARTFARLHEVDALRQLGLARGGTLDNTIVLDDVAVMNPGGLRWPDEFVRHKVVDLLGDLALVGAPIEGRVVAHKSGHGLHVRLARAVREAVGGAVVEVD